MCVLGCGGMLCFAGVVRCTFFRWAVVERYVLVWSCVKY